MRHQEFTTIEDLVFNQSFREWVLSNGDKGNQFWQEWVAQNPAKGSLLNYAKTIVVALSVNHKQLSEEEIKEEISAILRRAEEDQAQSLENLEPAVRVTKSGKPIVRRMYLWTAGAAAAILLIITSISYFKNERIEKIDDAAYYELVDSKNSSSIIEQINNSDSIQLVTLSDASRVQLYPKSKLSYSHSSFTNKREVFLTGEAFFEVQKNPSTPFLVYTKNMVTKVLGTSFTVKSYSGENKASVLVRTGRVSVYKKENFSERNAEAKKLDGIIVTPNQQVVYDFASNQLNKTIVDKPVLLDKKSQNVFAFNSTPLKEVFEVLQNAYGITIMYDESAIDSCSLSASLGNESYFEKLDLICKAIDATYETIDGAIFINSHGCK
jgi:ferric-dicitrate binding protein FerR (iron transport regulator)